MLDYYRDRRAKADAENARLWDILTELVRSIYDSKADDVGLKKLCEAKVEELKAILHG